MHALMILFKNGTYSLKDDEGSDDNEDGDDCWNDNTVMLVMKSLLIKLMINPVIVFFVLMMTLRSVIISVSKTTIIYWLL